MKTPLVLLPLLAAACGGAAPLADSDQSDLVGAPAAFALQFAGTYLGDGALTRLELQADGTYLATRDGRSERGRFFVAHQKALPLALFLARPLAHQAAITAYDGRLHMGDQLLVLQRPSASDEDLCGASGGAWTDDDPDPLTGLYCVCRAPAAFIPARGGCVEPPY
jgi:hypothetical protein